MQQQDILQALQAILQKNRGENTTLPSANLPAAQVSPLQSKPIIQQQQQNGQSQPAPFSQTGVTGLGFFGGLGDTKDAQGNIDPSWITQLNQGLMKQSSDINGTNTNLPWQTSPGQQTGENLGNKFISILSSIGSFF